MDGCHSGWPRPLWPGVETALSADSKQQWEGNAPRTRSCRKASGQLGVLHQEPGAGGPRGGGAGSVQRRKRSRGTTAEMEPGHLGPPCCRSACPHGGGQQTRGDSDVSAARSSLQKVTFRLLQNRTEFRKTPSMVDRICTNSERKVVLTAMLEQPDVYVGRDKPDAHFG